MVVATWIPVWGCICGSWVGFFRLRFGWICLVGCGFDVGGFCVVLAVLVIVLCT